MHPGPVGADRGHVVGALRHHPRQRHLSGDAAVPRQRHHGQLGAGAGARRDGGVAPAVLRIRIPARRPPLPAPRTSTTWAGRWPTSWRRRPPPTTPTTASNWDSAPRRRPATWSCFPPGSAAGSSRTTARAKASSPSTARPAPPRRRSGRPPEGPAFDVIVADPATGVECPPARFDGNGGLVNAGEAIGETRQSGRGGLVRGLLRQRGRQCRATSGRLVLERRPRLSRRGGLVLLRGPRLGLAAGRRRELRGRPHRTHPAPLAGCVDGGRLRHPRPPNR